MTSLMICYYQRCVLQYQLPELHTCAVRKLVTFYDLFIRCDFCVQPSMTRLADALKGWSGKVEMISVKVDIPNF